MNVLGIVHVSFEDLGSLGDALAALGTIPRVVDACTVDYETLDVLSPDLVVVMGGPVGVYETEAFPFLKSQLTLLGLRLARRLPTLGICLGAQLLAATLGAAVYPGAQGKEIGWSALEPGPDVAGCPAMSELLMPEVAVLHWHGDTFDLPAGAMHLAATKRHPHQAWSIGERILALQFHPEVIVSNLERWYVGHACELSAARIDVPRLRAQGHQFGPALYPAARRFWARWLATALTVDG